MASDTSTTSAQKTSPTPAPNPSPNTEGRATRAVRHDRWWLRQLFGAGLVLGVGVLLIVLLGVAQRTGWLAAGGGEGHAHAAEASVTYTCAMHPNIRSPEPGPCPICAMPLVPATSAVLSSDPLAVHIAPAARRLANIQTAKAERRPLGRAIRAVGALNYDEQRLATISGYVGGRIEKLFADYTGVVVEQGDPMALLYSPELYAAQSEYLQALEALKSSGGAGLARFREVQQELADASRDKLIELGMTAEQVRELAQSGEAQTRLTIHAPIGGTVLRVLAREGRYVKKGEPIYRVADLSKVWLMLELFPEDAARLEPGQAVEARVKSLPGEKFHGRVAFIDPMVDPQTRTIGVRVEIDNAQGRLRPGDYATAAIEVPLGEGDAAPLVVPRSAVLMAGENSVVYVETDPGRFEIRPVTLGPLTARYAVIVEGVKEGEQVATAGNFLIDSQMQLAGKPSLIDPAKAKLDLMKPDGPLELKDLTTRQFAGPTGAALERMYRAYFVIAAALSEDQTATAEQAAALRAAAEDALAANDLPDELKKLVEPVAKRAEDLRDENVDEARVAFLKISPNVIRLAARARGAEAESAFIQFHCFMHGDWLQAEELLANPYCGRKSKMIRCGKKVRELPARL